MTARPALDAPAPVDDPATVDYGLDFDGYVRGNSARLCRSAFLLTGDHQLAEDLVQTALAKVAPRWARIVQGGDPTPYVRTVMVRTAIAWRRRRWRGEVPTAPLPDDGRLEPVDGDRQPRTAPGGALGSPAAPSAPPSCSASTRT